jgi:hypothetical protein
MTITSRHDSSASILAKVKTLVNQRVTFTRDSTAFDAGVQATRDAIKALIDTMEKQGDT